MTTNQPGFQEDEQLRPIQLIQVGSRQAVPAPLIRVMTCGLLGIEVIEEIVSLDPPLARYVSLPVEQLRGRGTLPALTLLKLLVSRHAWFAPRDWFREQYRRDGEAFASERLSNIVSQLRGLLCPPAYEDLRRQIVAHIHCSLSSGGGYQLASYPLVWCDHEALTWHVEQAARMERFCDARNKRRSILGKRRRRRKSLSRFKIAGRIWKTLTISFPKMRRKASG